MGYSEIGKVQGEVTLKGNKLTGREKGIKDWDSLCLGE